MKKDTTNVIISLMLMASIALNVKCINSKSNTNKEDDTAGENYKYGDVNTTDNGTRLESLFVAGVYDNDISDTRLYIVKTGVECTHYDMDGEIEIYHYNKNNPFMGYVPGIIYDEKNISFKCFDKTGKELHVLDVVPLMNYLDSEVILHIYTEESGGLSDKMIRRIQKKMNKDLMINQGGANTQYITMEDYDDLCSVKALRILGK